MEAGSLDPADAETVCVMEAGSLDPADAETVCVMEAGSLDPAGRYRELHQFLP
jgi:hypothetical protein